MFQIPKKRKKTEFPKIETEKTDFGKKIKGNLGKNKTDFIGLCISAPYNLQINPNGSKTTFQCFKTMSIHIPLNITLL